MTFPLDFHWIFSTNNEKAMKLVKKMKNKKVSIKLSYFTKPIKKKERFYNDPYRFIKRKYIYYKYKYVTQLKALCLPLFVLLVNVFLIN